MCTLRREGAREYGGATPLEADFDAEGLILLHLTHYNNTEYPDPHVASYLLQNKPQETNVVPSCICL
jgi:hypothetical protein